MSLKPEDIKLTDRTVSLNLQDPSSGELNHIEVLYVWLRDNCTCATCYNPDTYQRLLDLSDLQLDIKPTQITITKESTTPSILIQWEHGHQSTYSLEWLLTHTSLYASRDPNSQIPDRELWNKSNFTSNATVSYPEVSFEEAINKSSALYTQIYKFGFCFINNVPVSGPETEKLCKKIGDYIQHTHYGGFWQFTTDPSMKDTAYSELEIPSHTDGTYWSHTPYLQLFHLLRHEGTGGGSTLVDGFKCAQLLKKVKPESFRILSTMKFRFQSLGDVCLSREREVIKVDSKTGEIVQIGFNNSDRAISFFDQSLDFNSQFNVYEALKDWHDIVHDEENILSFQLQPGKVLIFDNWRTLHARVGRTTGLREMCGAYFDKDDFVSNLILSLNKDKEEQLFNSL